MSYHVLTGASEILPSYAAVIHMHNNTANGLGFLITYNVETLIIIIIIIADNKSFQRELTSPLTSIKLNKNNIKSLVSCRAVKFSKEKSFQFLLESWSAGGCPDVCGKDVPSCRTSNTERPLAKLQ